MTTMTRDFSGEPKTPSQSTVIMTEIVLPQHTNSLGTVFGGVILSWIDIAASICAQRHSGKVAVTASIDAMNFLAPIPLGYTVNIFARLNYVGKSSGEVEVRVTSENPWTGAISPTADAFVTMVAIDQERNPVRMPPLHPETVKEKKRFEQAIERRKARLALKRRHED